MSFFPESRDTVHIPRNYLLFSPSVLLTCNMTAEKWNVICMIPYTFEIYNEYKRIIDFYFG